MNRINPGQKYLERHGIIAYKIVMYGSAEPVSTLSAFKVISKTIFIKQWENNVSLGERNLIINCFYERFT